LRHYRINYENFCGYEFFSPLGWLFSNNGIESIHWPAVGAASASDAEIMTYAVVHGYTVFTHDLDFSAILAATHKKNPSVIQIRSADIYPGNTAMPVITILRQAAVEIEHGALVTINANKSRVRILPLI
jgi:predicted nuclease of predicted toxin-antitoxin system